MKNFLKQVLVRGLPALLVLTAAGCGGSSSGKGDDKPAESAAEPASGDSSSSTAAVSDAGTYKICGVNMEEDAIVKLDTLEGYYIELKDGGSGYLYFGDDNKGDLTSWSSDGGKFSMKAGVSDFTGTMKNGILELEIGEDNVLTFAKEGADTSGLKILTVDEYKKMLTEQTSSSAKDSDFDPSVAGDYVIYAAESQGLCILIPDEDKETFSFTLKEDGTGTVYSGGDSEPVLWKLDGEVLTFYELNGDLATADYDITLKDGIMTFFVPGDGADDPDVYEYLVKEGADTSEIDKKAVDPSTLN